MIRTGIVSISGEPNVGKSTLLNAIMGQKLAIVSPRPQTTRGVIRGIYNGDGVQILFVDNPGFLAPKNKLDQFMFKQARESIKQAELVYLVVTHEMPDNTFTRTLPQEITRGDRPVFLIINKVDIIPKGKILPVIDAYQSLYPFKKIIPLSAVTGENIDVLLSETRKNLPESEPLFPEDMVSDQYERFFVAELIREKVFQFTHQEIPYSVAVKIDEFKPREIGKWFIRATLVVERDSHKGILIGRDGLLIKKIGQTARRDIENFLDTECYLELFVKVVKNWKKNDHILRELGYVISD